MFTLYHDNDPAAPAIEDGGRTYRGHRWHYVYLHGAAERLNELRAAQNGWEWAAPDLFVCDKPMPEEDGEHYGLLYGKLIAVVISSRQTCGVRGGRASLLKDAVGLAHARRPQDWM